MLKNFVVNKKPRASSSLEIFFDFVVVATVSILFNGFILNSHSAPAYQKFFMMFNAGLITTYWYSYSFFRQRFEKNNVFFRVITMIKVITLALIAAGLDLMIFRLNVVAGKDPNWIAKASMIIWVGGYIASRFLSFAEYMLCAFVNREDNTILKLTLGKGFSRLAVTLMALIHLTLLLKGFSIPYLTYSFLPLYLITEFVGNIAFVTDRNLEKAPKVSIEYASQRYKKLTYLYIGSLFISGTIQFAYYFHNSGDIYMIYRLLLIYLIGFLMWWFYSEYSHRLIIKQSARNLVKLAFLNIFVTSAMAVFGGAIINSHNSVNSQYIMIAAPVALSVILLCIHFYLSSLYRHDKVTILNFQKHAWVLCGINVTILITYAITSYFVSMPIWSIYIVIPLVMVSTIILPYVLGKKHCPDMDKCKLIKK